MRPRRSKDLTPREGSRNFMRIKTSWVAKAAVLAAVVALSGCSSAQNQGAPARQAAEGKPRPAAPARPRVVHPHNRPVPILMYHVVGTAPPGSPFPSLYVRRADFAGQLSWLRAHRFHAISLPRVSGYWRPGYALPPRPVVLTFAHGH